jgi:hypothetical protein
MKALWHRNNAITVAVQGVDCNKEYRYARGLSFCNFAVANIDLALLINHPPFIRQREQRIFSIKYLIRDLLFGKIISWLNFFIRNKMPHHIKRFEYVTRNSSCLFIPFSRSPQDSNSIASFFALCANLLGKIIFFYLLLMMNLIQRKYLTDYA